MRIQIEGRDHDYQSEIKAVTDKIGHLTKDPDAAADRSILLNLAERLLIHSHSHFLLELPAEQLVAWLKTFLEFLRQRDDLVNVRHFSPDDHDHAYLLVNTPDVSFLVDSLQMLFRRLQMRAVVISHPILDIVRKEGEILQLGQESPAAGRESFIMVQVEPELRDPDRLQQDVRETVELVQCVGQQRKAIDERLEQVAELARNQDQADFFAWLRRENFACFGYFQVAGKTSGAGLEIRLNEDPLGWVPDALLAGIDRDGPHAPPREQHRSRLERTHPLMVEVLDQPSLLHQDESLSYIGFREETGPDAWLEHGFVGLFTQTSINELTFNVPTLKQKICAAFERQHVLPGSYDYRKVRDIINTFPKIELFFLDDQQMDILVRSLVALQRYQTVKVMVTRSLSEKGITLVMIMPRDFYSGATLGRLEAYLRRYFRARRIDSRIIHFYSEYLSLHVRVEPADSEVKVEIDRIEKMLTDLARPWSDRLRHLLQREHGNKTGTTLWQRYIEGMPDEYRALIHPRFALRDIRQMEEILADNQERFDLWGPFREQQEFFRLQFYSLRESCLNDLMPFLENLSLSVVDEVDFNITAADRTIYIKSFAIRNDHPDAQPLAPQREVLLETLAGLRRGVIEDDYLNRVMLLTGLDWKQVDIFRAYRNYYFQLGNPFTKRRVAFALINNPAVAGLLYRYFEARFLPKEEWHDPLQREEDALMPVRMDLARALEQVEDINEDRILRNLFNLIDSTVRTNFFLRRDDEDYFLAFKISAIGIIDMPFPRPMYETYVHSSSMEGIHLRGGRVARGGIRWSDRPDDFRTEVLGLMKAQMTKNALIVPVGSKGGFVVKTPFADRDEGRELSRQAYITLMRGLLDLVDNRVEGELKRPDGVVVYDDPDPYLVVAADKGTAHLPDTANEVSCNYGFWLGDAFASGGSAGYDHKELGITARGAWECVKRHFREMGKDIQNEDFTVVGIGDMSGDVFGNGMLLSRHIRLLAAFNHMHIFLDPDPDAASSWEERRRLFDLPRSTWADYNPELISPGGGVWPRSTKEIPLSPEVRAWLGVRHASMDGEGLIRRLLSADCELLWNGGIGTYVKAAGEKHEDAGDRANDNVRINADHLKARVVGEGGNLGMTQRARIEYALDGGRLNTDAIDNSAGVDTSDHEVNLKIFCQTLQELGQIEDEQARNRLLDEIEEEVCSRVLRNNYTQSLCLSLDKRRCREDIEPFIDLSSRLVNAGLLDREGEFLPSRKELAARATGYTRPELAVLLSYSKMHLYQALIDSDLPEREAARSFLVDYFPALIGKRYGNHLQNHPLKREIIATMITNRLIDQAGCCFLNNLSRMTGATPVRGVAAYLIFDKVLRGNQIRQQVFAGDNRLNAERQYEILLNLERTLGELCGQVIEQDLPMSLDETCVTRYRERLELFLEHLRDLLSGEEWQSCQEEADALAADGLSDEHAQLLGASRFLVSFLPAVHIAETRNADLFTVTEIMNDLRNRLQFPLINHLLGEFLAHDRWDRLALASLRNSFIRQFVRIADAIVERKATVSSYFADRRQRVETFMSLVDGLRTSPPTSTSPFMVVLRAMETLAE